MLELFSSDLTYGFAFARTPYILEERKYGSNAVEVVDEFWTH